jgi:hypothetical protein
MNRDQVRYRIEKFGLRAHHEHEAPHDAPVPVPA